MDNILEVNMINTLVKHKQLHDLGIGCIAKELKHAYKVNFGRDDVLTCKKSAVEIIDTSACKTIPFSEFRKMVIVDSKDLPHDVIIGNELKHYVGIGFTHTSVVTEEDLKNYPRII